MLEAKAEAMGTMARDAQRRQAGLNRHVHAKEKASKDALLPPRPLNPNQCSSLEHATSYRHQVIRDVSHLMSGLSAMTLEPPPALSQSTEDDADLVPPEELAAARRQYDARVNEVRELNRSINEHLRKLEQWDRRVVALGGSAIRRPPSSEHTVRGVTYFGPARQLPEYLDHVRAAKQHRAEGQASASAASEPVAVVADDALAAAYTAENDDESEGQGPCTLSAAAFDPFTVAASSDYDALLADAQVRKAGPSKGGPSVPPPALLCLGAPCCTPQPPSRSDADACCTAAIFAMQIRGEIAIGEPLAPGAQCPTCAGDASVRQEWLRRLEERDRRAVDEHNLRVRQAQASEVPPYRVADLLSIGPLSESSFAAFDVEIKKQRLKARLAGLRASAAPTTER